VSAANLAQPNSCREQKNTSQNSQQKIKKQQQQYIINPNNIN